MTVGWALVLALASTCLGCAKADEPKAPPQAPTITPTAASAVSLDGGETDASAALRSLPMPQQFPRIAWDAASFDASRDAARR